MIYAVFYLIHFPLWYFWLQYINTESALTSVHYEELHENTWHIPNGSPWINNQREFPWAKEMSLLNYNSLGSVWSSCNPNFHCSRRNNVVHLSHRIDGQYQTTKCLHLFTPLSILLNWNFFENTSTISPSDS